MVTEFEWLRTTDAQNVYGIYLRRDGVLYPLAVIDFATTFGGEDLKRLLRASPKLLEVCEGLLLSADASWEDNDLGHDWKDACEIARAAIAEVKE